MFDKVATYLDETGIPFAKNESGDTITFLARMHNSSFHCVLEIKEPMSFLVFYTTISSIVPENRRAAISELLTRINYNTLIGNFEMDFGDGEIRYKTSIDYEGTELSHKTLGNLISANLSIADDYFYTIVKGISTDLSPIEILDAKEAKRENIIDNAV